MPNIDPLFEVGAEIGVGGAVALTGKHTGKPSLWQVMYDFAVDLEALNVAGAHGLSLEHTPASVPADLASAGAFVIPGAGLESDYFREMLKRIAADIDALITAEGLGAWGDRHQAADVPHDFMSGGRHLQPNRDVFPGRGVDGLYLWIGDPLYFIARDIVKINVDGSVGASLLTSVTVI